MKKKDFEKRNHYAIRKLTVGAASVLIGTTILLGGKNVDIVHAAKKDGDESPSVVETSDVKTPKITSDTKVEVHPASSSADTKSDTLQNQQGGG